MDISKLPLELTLNLAEQMDTMTLFNFMITNKELYKIIKTYEHSICHTHSRSFPLCPEGGSILSSHDVDRKRYSRFTFPWLMELSRREDRIDAIIHSGFIDLTTPPGLNPTTPRQQQRFKDMLSRSLRHCNAIADITANANDTTEGGVGGAGAEEEEGAEYDYTMISAGYWNLAGSLPKELRQRDPFTNIGARAAQIAYLKSLPIEDLAGLYLSITAVSVGHVSNRPAIRGDPNFAERVTVYEECVLRHGTWFLWAQATGRSDRTEYGDGGAGGGSSSSNQRDDDNRNSSDGKTGGRDLTLKEMTGYMLMAGFAELISWETGLEKLPPGLRMSLIDAAKGRFVDGDRRPVIYHLYKLAEKLVYEPDETS